MKFDRLLPLVVLIIAGCSGDSVSKLVAPSASAAIRWVNAVPDTMPLDYRVIDVVTNANEASIAYRSSSGGYRQLPPGSHHIRIFLAGTTAAGNAPSVVQTVVLDTTFDFAVNHYYTVLHAGYMKSGASPKHRLIITDDVFPPGTAGSISVRAVNAMASAADIFASMAVAAGGAVTPPAAFSGVAFGSATPYVGIAVAPAAPAASTYRIAVTAAGAPSTIVADGLAPVGAPATDSSAAAPALNAVAGTQQSASVLTFVATPPAVSYVLTASGTNPAIPAGTTTTVAGTTTGTVITLLDKNPKDKLLGQ